MQRRILPRQKYSSKEHFIARAQAVHGDKYDYSSIVWSDSIKAADKVLITCPEHGIFTQRITEHVMAKHGCYSCHKTPITNSLDSIKAVFGEVHGNKYDYSSVLWSPTTRLNTKVQIICPEHGLFEQSISGHRAGRGCRACAGQERFSSVDNIISRSKLVHGSKYDYSLVRWNSTTNAATKIVIICRKHGAFEQRIGDHINGKNGCPMCKSSRGEVMIATWLTANNITYNQEHKFVDCRNPKTNRQLRFDFYLPDHNTCIEFHGKQHYVPFEFSGGPRKQTNSDPDGEPSIEAQVALVNSLARDQLKIDYCTQHNIRLMVISYTQFDTIADVLMRELIEYGN